MEMLLGEIDKAQHFINIQVMLFYSDEAGYKVAEALAAKARAGVMVRVMSDSGMSRVVRMLEKYRSSGTSDFSDLQELFERSGVNFEASDDEAYHLHNWEERRKKLSDRGVPEEFLVMQDAIQEGIFLDANVFDHRKIFVFDGETAIVTGANIGNRYLYAQKPTDALEEELGKYWHDGGLKIKGPCVAELNNRFASKWMVRSGEVFDYTEHYRSRQHYGTDVCTVYHHSCYTRTSATLPYSFGKNNCLNVPYRQEKKNLLLL